MLDLRKFSRGEVKDDLKKRNIEHLKHLDIDELFSLYERNKKTQSDIEDIRAQANTAAKNQDYTKGAELKALLRTKEDEQSLIIEKLNELWVKVPNILHESVPIGKDSDYNVCIKQKGDIIFNKNHYDMDIFEECTDFTGSRFVILKSEFATIERALACFMMDFLKKKGFCEFSVPYLLNSKGLLGSGHLPKDAENMFKIENEDKYLIPTGEPVLVNLGRDKRWDETKRFCTFTDCFRKEAGSAGKDLKGLIRLHQFKKCEMVCFADPGVGYTVLEEMLENSCEILDLLEIPWRILLLCSGDSPITSAKTYDIEVPIGGKWREIASISNCTDYQSYNINCRNSNKEFLHILNGSALAVGRTLATLLEVHYQENGIVKIPKILNKYLDFSEVKV